MINHYINEPNLDFALISPDSSTSPHSKILLNTYFEPNNVEKTNQSFSEWKENRTVGTVSLTSQISKGEVLETKSFNKSKGAFSNEISVMNKSKVYSLGQTSGVLFDDQAEIKISPSFLFDPNFVSSSDNHYFTTFYFQMMLNKDNVFPFVFFMRGNLTEKNSFALILKENANKQVIISVVLIDDHLKKYEFDGQHPLAKEQLQSISFTLLNYFDSLSQFVFSFDDGTVTESSSFIKNLKLLNKSQESFFFPKDSYLFHFLRNKNYLKSPSKGTVILQFAHLFSSKGLFFNSYFKDSESFKTNCLHTCGFNFDFEGSSNFKNLNSKKNLLFKDSEKKYFSESCLNCNSVNEIFNAFIKQVDSVNGYSAKGEFNFQPEVYLVKTQDNQCVSYCESNQTNISGNCIDCSDQSCSKYNKVKTTISKIDDLNYSLTINEDLSIDLKEIESLFSVSIDSLTLNQDFKYSLSFMKESFNVKFEFFKSFENKKMKIRFANEKQLKVVSGNNVQSPIFDSDLNLVSSFDSFYLIEKLDVENLEILPHGYDKNSSSWKVLNGLLWVLRIMLIFVFVSTLCFVFIVSFSNSDKYYYSELKFYLFCLSQDILLLFGLVFLNFRNSNLFIFFIDSIFSITLGFANISANDTNSFEYSKTSVQFKYFNLSNYILKNGLLPILISGIALCLYISALLDHKFSKNKRFSKFVNKHFFSDFLFLFMFPCFSILFCFSIMNIAYFDFQSTAGIINFVISVIFILLLLTGNLN